MCKLFLCSEVLCFRFRFANWIKSLWWTKVWQNVYLWLEDFFYVDYSWLKNKNVKGLHCGIVTQIVHTLIQTCPLFFSWWQKRCSSSFFICVDNGSFCSLIAEKFDWGLESKKVFSLQGCANVLWYLESVRAALSA